MSNLSLQQLMASRFRTSSHADNQTKQLMEFLGLSTKTAVARLAIGRSLALGQLPTESIDSKGLEIPASSLFTQEDVAIWVGLLVTHARIFGGPAVDGMDQFRNLVRQHWHRGSALLLEDWADCNEDFDTFVGTLVKRRADLQDRARVSRGIGDEPQVEVAAVDQSSQLIRALGEIGVLAEIKGVTHGPRLSRYRVSLRDINQLDKLKRGLERVALAMSLQHHAPTLGPGDEARTVMIDIPRQIEAQFRRPCVGLFHLTLRELALPANEA